MSSANLNTGEASDARLHGLHVVTLSCLAFALPVLDLVGRTAEFLVIRRIGAGELSALLGALIALPPLPFLAIALAGELAGRRAGRACTAVVAGFLAGLIALRVESAGTLADGFPSLAVAALVGIAFGLLYHRRPLVRSFVTFLAPALLIVPLAFLMRAEVRRAISPPHESNAARISGAPAPVFFLVFDELSFAALVDEHGVIDAARYPNLARLAGTSTWYRNAHTAADTTNVSIPAMLTSRFPRVGSLPFLADHPVNLFTLFGGAYTIRADEPITRLCPERLNTFTPDSAPFMNRITSVITDLSVVWLHLELPPAFRRLLPSISSSWEGFAAGPAGASAPHTPPAQPKNAAEFYDLAVSELSKGRRAERFRQFLRGIDAHSDKTLNFAHVMLPHTPWEHFPSGQLYTVDGGRIAGLDGDSWQNDAEAVRMGAVQYLMQTEFVDRLVGEFVRTLESANIFDDALIVIVSDHGVSFRPGDKRRGYSTGNAADVVPIPLLIKAPKQRTGAIVDEPVTTLDILPTMVDLLGVTTGAAFEGRSTVAAAPATVRKQLIATAEANALPVDIATIDANKYETVRALARLLGPRDDPYRAGRSAPRAELLGRSVSSLQLRDGNLLASLFNPDSYRNYDVGNARVPALVAGAVRNTENELSELALAINGTIVATARTGAGRDGLQLFGAILPEAAFETRFDDVVIYRVVDQEEGTRSEPTLERTRSGSRRAYRLTTDEQGRPQSLVADGAVFPLGRKLDGWIESTEDNHGMVRITGWAADVTGKRLASEVVVFHGDAQVASGGTWVAKGYVAAGLGESAYMLSGFSFDVPSSALPRLARNGVRAFAISDDGNATELGTLFLRVENGPEGERLVRSNGVRYSVVSRVLDGATEAVETDGEGTALRGWAADRERNSGAERVVVVFNGRAVKEVVPLDERSDLEWPGGVAPPCGFRMHFDVRPEAARDALRSGRARVFATSAGSLTASELRLAPQGD